MIELAADVLEYIVVGQVTDVTEQDVLALTTILADLTKFYRIRLNHKGM